MLRFIYKSLRGPRARGHLKLRASVMDCRVALLLAMTTISHAGVPPVIYPPGPFKPGHTLVVEVPANSKKAPVLFWGNKKIPFFKAMHGHWRALTRIPLDLGAGEHGLVVHLKSSHFLDTIPVKFKIQSVASDFGFETITFPEDKKRLLNDPSEGEESLEIRKFLALAEKDLDQYWEGKFLRPIPGEILSPFGIKRNKVGRDAPDFHRGIDLRGPQGQTIKATNTGKVIMVRDFKYHGRTVLISHGQGIASIAIHMHKVDVREGEMVKKGQKIGEVGMSGLATAPHLHWGHYVHGEAVNALQWLEESF